MMPNPVKTLLSASIFLSFCALSAQAQEVRLRLHHFLAQQSTVPAQILDPWADAIEAASDGRIKIDRFPAMQLGGTPAELIDQVQDGVADIIWTVVGYTPGRFPRSEVFELPFMVGDAAAASYAYWTMFDRHMRAADFADYHVLGTWVHGPGLIHANRDIATPDDLAGLKIRGGSRMVTELLTLLGAEAVGMPAPAVPESLSRGVIDGATLPWEVTPSLRVAELVDHHTEFEGPALYNLTFVLAMNADVYADLPDDLRAIIDAHSGLEFSVASGRLQQAADAPARQIAVDAGNMIRTIPQEEAALWAQMAQPIYADWVADMAARGIDGQALIDEARALMAEFDG